MNFSTNLHRFIPSSLLILIIFSFSNVNCDIFDNFVGKYNYNLSSVQKISSSCKNTLQKISQFNFLKVIDSSAKIPTGILNLNLYDLGNYDECYDLTDNVDGLDIYGKYCMGALTISLDGLNEHSRQEFFKAHPEIKAGTTGLNLGLGYCLPSTCDVNDFQSVFTWAKFSEELCSSRANEPKLEARDITALVIYSVFAALVISSTCYDIFLYYIEMEPFHGILIAFSLWTNSKKLMKTSSNPDQLSCIHGIKAFSMVWVVYGHVNSSITSFPLNNLIDVVDFMQDKKNMYLLAAPVSVDTFFAIGGLLTMYTFLKSMDKGVKLNVPLFYLHRFLRLTPAFAAMVLFYATLIRFMGNGPVWSTVDTIMEPCQKYWWSTLLYIQNYVEPTKSCLGQSWYLAVDMQMFVLTPLVLIPMQKWPKIGIYLLTCLALAGFAVPFAVSYILDLNASMVISNENAADYMKYYYIQTYARFGPYVIGMIFGYIIYNLRQNREPIDNMNRKTLLLITGGLWIVGIGGLIVTTYGNADVIIGEVDDKVSKSFHNGLDRNAWAVAVCIIVTLCCLGLGGPINDFLSLPMFQFLAKISYSIYLVHGSVIILTLLNTRTLSHFSVRNVNNSFWSDFMISVIISFFFCAIFESPIITIEKFLFGKARGAPSNPKEKK